jgi:hypothetical protein
MATLYKEGVFGEMQPKLSEAKRKLARKYAANGEDLVITSIREGNHTISSFHWDGRAFDHRKGGISLYIEKQLLGDDFDIIDETNHRHVEYDPK